MVHMMTVSSVVLTSQHSSDNSESCHNKVGNVELDSDIVYSGMGVGREAGWMMGHCHVADT